MELQDHWWTLWFTFQLFLSDLVNFVWNFAVYVWNIRKERVPLPPITNPLLLKSATQLAKEIREKKVTSEEVVRAFAERIKEVNPITNACAEIYTNQAIENAKEVDEELAKASEGDLEKIRTERPLLGVPFSCKDQCEIEGTTTTFGAWSQRDHVSEKTDLMAGLYLKAGAILIAKTTVPEMCMWLESNNAIHGTTGNPYDNRRNAGGSSGGEGSLLGSGGSAVGLGSDIGGSIRIPSSLNGIYGLKPSPGVFPMDGGFGNPAESLLAVFGPMSRYVEDLETVLKFIPDLKSEDVSKFSVKNVLVPGEYNLPWVPRMSQEQRDATKKVVDFLLEEYKLSVEGCIDLNPVRQGFVDNFLGVFNDFGIRNNKPETTMDGIFSMANGKFNTLTELPKYLLGRSHHTLASCLQITHLNRRYSLETLDMYKEKLTNLRDHYDTLLSTTGIIVQPGWPTVAKLMHAELACLDFAYTGVFNYLGLPSIICPIGLNEDGLPLNVSITGPRYSELHLIDIAKKIDKKFGGWVPPPSCSKEKGQ
ncbi:unnamed protein product, partial [Mesorhabditis spiculigera]